MTDPLDPYDSWLVRALQAPGAPHELVGEDDAVGEFRAVSRRRKMKVLAGRVGAGGAVVAVVLSGAAAAAAYTSALPTPIQRAAHGIFHGVGVPNPAPHRPSTTVAGGHHHPTVHRSSSPAPAAAPASAAPGSTSDRPTSRPQAPTTPRPSTAATPPAPDHVLRQRPVTSPGASSPAPSETSGSSSGGSVPAVAAGPAVLHVSWSTESVGPGGSVVVSASVTSADGAPVAHRAVSLTARPAAASHSHVVVSGRTGPRGLVTLTDPSVAATSTLRVVAGPRTSSAPTTVTVHPVLTATAARVGGTGVVSVTVRGARPGDRVSVGHDGHVLAHATLGADGHVVLRFHPGTPAVLGLVVHVAATPAHASAMTRVTLPHAATGGSPSATPGPSAPSPSSSPQPRG